tara:strand:+ start:134 stop:403 length:270 start_codon:yes stop_codon:yes gene_type:complete
MITLTEVKKVFNVSRTLTSAYPRDEIERKEIVLNPESIVLLEPHESLCGIKVTKIVLKTGGHPVTKIVEGTVSSIRDKIQNVNKRLING